MGNLENSLNATEIELLEQQIANSECVIVKNIRQIWFTGF